jgi:hypothetical protein
MIGIGYKYKRLADFNYLLKMGPFKLQGDFLL